MPQPLAARIYDQEHHSDADLAFLDAISAADDKARRYIESAARMWGAGSVPWECVKRMAVRSQMTAYRTAVDTWAAR